MTTPQELLPLFLAGFAVSRLLEFISMVWDKLWPARDKTVAMAMSSLIFALVLTWGAKLHTLKDAAWWVDGIVTILAVSAGTEGANSILKFLTYKKEETEAKAKTAEETLSVLRKHSTS